MSSKPPSRLATLENFLDENSSEENLAEDSRIEVRQIRCSSLLHEMSFGATTEYTINQYRGCTHGCVYCYAPSLIHEERSWGSYVDVKMNAHYVLDRELDHAKKKVVFVSSASDPYQPVEARFKITQRVLKVLAKHRFPVLLLTRSPLVLRDLEILQSFDWIRVGFSISSVPTRFYEPGVPSLERRIEALSKLHDCGIKTFVSMAPIIPRLILMDLDLLFARLSEAGLSTISFGLLRFNGYEKSREMFEQRSGQTSEEVMEGGRSVYQEVKRRAADHGLDITGSVLSWSPSEDSNQIPSMDNFPQHGEPFSN